MASRQLCVIAAMLLILPSCSATVFTVVWTTMGVTTYSSGWLQVELGDVVTFRCTSASFSNIIYQSDQAQFDACNTTVTNGDSVPFAECRGSERDVNLTIDSRSASLDSAIPIMAGEQLFFTSYSTGTAASATMSQTMGGECLMGLKLAISIADGPTVSTTPGGIPGPEGVSPDPQSDSTVFPIIWIIVGCVLGGAVLVIVLVCLILLYIRKKKMRGEVYPGKMETVTENGKPVLKTVTSEMNGSSNSPASGVAKEREGGKPVVPFAKPAKPTSTQHKNTISDGMELQSNRSADSAASTGAKKNDSTSTGAGSNKAKVKPTVKVAPYNPQKTSKDIGTGTPSKTSGQNTSGKQNSTNPTASIPASKVGSASVSKPSLPPVSVVSEAPKPTKSPNAKKVVGTGNKVTRSFTPDSAPASKGGKPVTPVTSSLGSQASQQGKGKATATPSVSNPVASHKTVKVPTSKGGQKSTKPGTTQSSTQNHQKTSTVSDKKPSTAERRPPNSSAPLQPGRRVAPPPPPNSQQKLPPLQRRGTDAGQQSTDNHTPLSSLPVKLTKK